MEKADFAVVGSSGGGGTIAWLLAKAGFSVVVLEQGADWFKDLEDDSRRFNPSPHDEYRFRLERPQWKRRLRGDYNTFRTPDQAQAAPFDGAWTASMLGGGSVIWGTWSLRALPIDFRLGTHYQATGLADKLKAWGYSVPDWPISHPELEPYYNVAETLLAVSGDRNALNESVLNSEWYKEFAAHEHIQQAGNWAPTFEYPTPAYPRVPVGELVHQGLEKAGMHSLPLPSGIVAPGPHGYHTRQAIDRAQQAWLPNDRPAFWNLAADKIWSGRVRQACNLCGYCGEYLCWGGQGPKSSSRATTLKELQDLPNAEIHTNAKAFEVIYDEPTRRATGVRYLDITDPDNPRVQTQKARFVIVACGAVQSARLLRLSGVPGGLGNRYDQVGRYAMFHLFGLSSICTLPEEFQGFLRGELGHTGNTASFDTYFVKDDRPASDTNGQWFKAGYVASTAKKNPLENATGLVQRKGLIGTALLTEAAKYGRTVELRLTGDDLPMARNRVDLDPHYVDEYGLPVARITRAFGEHEKRMSALIEPKLRQVFEPYRQLGADVTFSQAILTLIGDHQMGTCRMGDDPTQSVVDRHCRLHDVPNVFVADTSVFPTGLGLNPMVTVVANALRVGTWIVEQARRGREL